MLDYIRGQLAYIEEDFIVVDVMGVGYRVFCPNPYLFQKEIDSEVKVYVYHHVREDAILLFGFPKREEQRLFRRLLDVSGIGPKGALGILSAARPEQIVTAIQREDLALLTKFPGIGKKTAQRMIIDLKDKLDSFAGDASIPAPISLVSSEGVLGGSRSEAVEALMTLGYQEAEVLRVMRAIEANWTSATSVETMIRESLKQFMKA